MTVNATIPKWRRVASVILITLMCLVGMADRYVTAGVLKEVQEFYSISDTMGGLLQTTYIVVYITNLVIVGYLGDRFTRKNIILTCCLLWLLFVIASSFIPANAFWLFMILRSLTGLCVSVLFCLGPPIFSDLFHGEALGYSLTLFFNAIVVGSGLGVIMGSLLIQSGSNFQWAIRVTPPFGAVVIILMFFIIQEPIRGGVEGAPVVTNEKRVKSVREDFRRLLATKTYCMMITTNALQNFWQTGNGWWFASYLIEASTTSANMRGMNGNSLVTVFSAITLVAGLVGPMILVAVSEKWRTGFGPLRRIQTVRAYPVTILACISVSIPMSFLFIAFASVDMAIMLVCAFFYYFFAGVLVPIGVAITMTVVPPTRRALAMATGNILMGSTGDGTAPFVIGALSDAFRAGTQQSRFYGLQKAMFVAAGVDALCIFSLIAVVVFYPGDLRRSEEEAKGQSQTVSIEVNGDTVEKEELSDGSQVSIVNRF